MRPRDVERRASPLAASVHDAAAVVLRDLLVAEAEAEDRRLEVVDVLRVGRVLAERGERRTAREDDALVRRERLDRIVGLADLGPHAQAAHLRGDEVRVLAAEIDDGHRVVRDEPGESTWTGIIRNPAPTAAWRGAASRRAEVGDAARRARPTTR